MAQIAINSIAWVPGYPGTISAAPNLSSTALTIDAADESVAFVVQAPKAGNISKVGWATRTVTTGATLAVRIESIDAATGFPSGTLLATDTSASQVVADANDNTSFLTTLTAVAAVTRGQMMAVVIQNPNTSFGNLQISAFADDADPAFPFSALNTGVSPAVSYAKTSNTPVLWLEYDDGSYAEIPNCWPINGTVTSTALSTATTPDVMGIRFRLQIPATLSHAWLYAEHDGDCKLMLVSDAYHQANATGILASLTLDADSDASAANIRGKYALDTAVVLAANTWYRLIVEPTSATALNFHDFNLHSLAAMDAWGGQDFHLTSAKDPTGDGSWTNYNSGTFRKPFMGLGFTAFGNDAGSGGGGLSILQGSVVG